MELLEKIVRKAVRQKRHIKYTTLFLSGVAEWIGGTYNEGKANKEMLTGGESEFVGEKDYKLYQSGSTLTMLGHCYLLWTMPPGEGPVVYALAADGVARAGNILMRELKKGRSGKAHQPDIYEAVGLIGTVRTLGYKLAGRLKRSEGDGKAEPVDDPFSDEDFLMPPAQPAGDAGVEGEDPLASVEQDDTGNKLF